MPSAMYQHTITIDAAPDHVWDGLQNPDIWSSLGPVQKVWDPVIDDGVLTGFLWSTEVGGIAYEGTGTAIVLERPARYQLVLDTSEMAGTITVDLADNGDEGTGVDIVLELRSKGFLSSMFFPVVSRAVGDGLREEVEDMAAQLSA